MIDFEEFSEYMSIYKKICDKEEVLNNALHDISNDFGGYHAEDTHNIILKMLKKLTNDTEDWISYYIYELNWGEEWKKGYITDKDGGDIPLKTFEDLYNILNNMKGNEE